ncbi:restriction endonuclease subunit S [Campylobacter devanensis]|uniref:restriction endonuclease subunit S n=1 Tax=Campylobacter devanensis TaxID=3161138 RepID=UPI001F0211FE|nr:restriction endonuclease subunit S [Campylobacter sp. P0222]
MFEKLNLSFRKSKFNKDNDVSKIKNSEFSIPLVNAKDGDNGIMYYGRPQDFETATMTIDIVNDGAVSTGNVYPQPQETGVLYNAYLIKSKFTASKSLLYFFATAIQKSIKLKFSYELKASWERVKNENIKLPITASGEIDFEFMESFVAELEAERVAELEAYLAAASLKDYELTADELSALSKFENYNWGEFRIGDLFEKLSAKFLGKGDKFKAVSKIKTTEFFVPVVYCKFGDNGIMYWAKKDDFETYKNVISIVYNGAIAAGKVYAQPHETGILAESYFIKFKNREIDFKVNLFFQCVLEKVLYPKYSRDYLATWDNKVENDVISLPVTASGEIDFEFMNNFIKAIKKLVIKDVVLYTDNKIKATKSIVSSNQ